MVILNSPASPALPAPPAPMQIGDADRGCRSGMQIGDADRGRRSGLQDLIAWKKMLNQVQHDEDF